LNRLKIPIFVVLISLTLLSTCFAKTEQTSARFKEVATGECLVWFGVLGPQPPSAIFIGEGAIALSGSSAVSEYPPNPYMPYTYYYTPENVKASGHLSARWKDQMISISIHSEDDTCGLFIDQGDVNYFTVGILPEEEMTPSLSYKGTFKDATGTQAVSGEGGVFAMPIGDPGNQFMAIGAVLWKQDGTPLLSIFWVPFDMPFGGPIPVHAAKQFIHSVEITTKP